MNEEAIALADKLIGPEVEVRMIYLDPMDEEPTPHQGDEAVRNFQRRQRLMLAEYQNKYTIGIDPAQPGADRSVETIIEPDDMVRVDPKTAKVTETALLNEERSEAEA